MGPTNKKKIKVFFQTNIFFSGTKNSKEQHLFSFLSIVKQKNFGVVQKFLKIFDFQKSLSKLGPNVEDFNS